MSTRTTWQNMIRGVALGDSWGDRNEFRSISDLTRSDPRGPELPQRLRITDDTQMSLYLARALEQSWDGGVDVVREAIVENYLTYNRDPDNNRAPGATVTSSLNRLAGTHDWRTATSSHSDGSGTVMRTASTALLPEDRWVGITALAAAITHGTPNGVAAAILMTAIIRGVLSGDDHRGHLLEYALELSLNADEYGLTDTGEWLQGYRIGLGSGFQELSRLTELALDNLSALRAEPWRRASDPSLLIGGGGWRAHETLIIALTAADMFPDDPWEALRRSVTSDGDSDTIGAVAGAILGAVHPEAFTRRWDELRGRLEDRYVSWIEQEADHYPPDSVEALPRWQRWAQRIAAALGWDGSLIAAPALYS